jgi:hypothetical protein
MLRVDRVLDQEERCEGSTTLLELELIADEIEHLADLYRTMLLVAIREHDLTPTGSGRE